MKLRDTAIAIGIGVATAAGLSLLKVNKHLVLGSTAVVAGAGLMLALRDRDDLNKKIKNYEYFFNRAQNKFEVANYKEAIFDYNKGLDFDPLYADGYFNRGSAKYNMGDFDGAIEDYKEVINISPKDSDAFFNRANVKKEIGDIKSACEELKEAANPGDEEAENLLMENCE